MKTKILNSLKKFLYMSLWHLFWESQFKNTFFKDYPTQYLIFINWKINKTNKCSLVKGQEYSKNTVQDRFYSKSV